MTTTATSTQQPGADLLGCRQLPHRNRTGNATFSTALKSGGTGVEGYQITPPILGIH